MKYLKHFETNNVEQNIKLLDNKLFKIYQYISEKGVADIRYSINRWDRFFGTTTKKFLSITFNFDDSLNEKANRFYNFIKQHLSKYKAYSINNLELKILYKDIPKFIKELDFYFALENSDKFNL